MTRLPRITSRNPSGPQTIPQAPAGLALMAQARGGPAVAAQVLFYPAPDAPLDTSIYQRWADGPWLSREALRWFWDAYLPDQGRRSEVTASPLQASLEQLRGLPP